MRRINERFAACGAYGHAWFESDSTWRPTFGFPITLRCERCGAERRDTVGSRGQLEARHYDYPSGYSYNGAQRPTRADFRLVVVKASRRRRREATEKVVPIRRRRTG